METTAFFSGHANSGAMIARMHKIGQPPDMVVHAVTGLEFDQVHEWMEKFERFLGIEVIREDITKEKPRYNFFTYYNTPWLKRSKFYGEIHGTPKIIDPCWHNRNVKQPVFKKYEAISSVTYTGFTVEERHRILAYKKGRIKRYPLIEWQWSANDSRKYLKKIGIPHPMYEVFGFRRLGCCICPKQNESQLRLIYENFPKIWDLILYMEDTSPKGFRVSGQPTPYDLMERWDREKNPKTTLSDFMEYKC